MERKGKKKHFMKYSPNSNEGHPFHICRQFSHSLLMQCHKKESVVERGAVGTLFMHQHTHTHTHGRLTPLCHPLTGDLLDAIVSLLFFSLSHRPTQRLYPPQYRPCLGLSLSSLSLCVYDDREKNPQNNIPPPSYAYLSLPLSVRQKEKKKKKEEDNRDEEKAEESEGDCSPYLVSFVVAPSILNSHARTHAHTPDGGGRAFERKGSDRE